VRSVRSKAFWGIFFLGVGTAVGGNDNPIWWTGHPMSNMTQTIILMGFVGLGAWWLSDVTAAIWKQVAKIF